MDEDRMFELDDLATHIYDGDVSYEESTKNLGMDELGYLIRVLNDMQYEEYEYDDYKYKLEEEGWC